MEKAVPNILQSSRKKMKVQNMELLRQRFQKKFFHSMNLLDLLANIKLTQAAKMQIKGVGVRVRGDAGLRCFWCGFDENYIYYLLLFILTCYFAM